MHGIMHIQCIKYYYDGFMHFDEGIMHFEQCQISQSMELCILNLHAQYHTPLCMVLCILMCASNFTCGIMHIFVWNYAFLISTKLNMHNK